MIRSGVKAIAETHILWTGLSGLKAIAGTHILLTGLSLSQGVFTGSLEEYRHEEPHDAKYFQRVTDVVSGMYTGKGVILPLKPNGKDWLRESVAPFVKFDEKASFEDPAAICCGPAEIHEAFRALKSMNPRALSLPRLVDVKPNSDVISLTYYLNQQYGNSLRLKSLLVVDVVVHDGDLVVSKIEERWNGVQPPENIFLRTSRRVNGLISWYLTPRLVSENK